MQKSFRVAVAGIAILFAASPALATKKECVKAYTVAPTSTPPCDQGASEYSDSWFPGKCTGENTVEKCREDGTVTLYIYKYRMEPQPGTDVCKVVKQGIEPTAKDVGQCDNS